MVDYIRHGNQSSGKKFGQPSFNQNCSTPTKDRFYINDNNDIDLVGSYDPSQAIDLIEDVEGSVFLLCVFETEEYGLLREWIQLEYFTEEYKRHIISNLKNYLKKVSVWQACRGYARHKTEQIDQICKRLCIEIRPKAFSSFEYAQTGNDVWVDAKEDYLDIKTQKEKSAKNSVHKRRVDPKFQSAFNSLKKIDLTQKTKIDLTQKTKNLIKKSSYMSGTSSRISSNDSDRPISVNPLPLTQ